MLVEMEDFCKKNFISSEHPTLRDGVHNPKPAFRKNEKTQNADFY
jgi:hypothetical protein